MLWQNDHAIIIGKHQNTLAEINESYVNAHGIRVVRRLSGGGAVYHDMGNLNFTFIADRDSDDGLDMKLFCQPVVRALAQIGVQAQINGRNDMTIDGRKFSGNSQYVKNGRVMHHGTILFASDLDVVNHALQVDPSKIRAKGVQSVRSRVTNVQEYLSKAITLAQFREHLLQQVLKETPGEPYELTKEDLDAIDAIRRSRYDTWQWNYGASPACTLLKRKRIEGCGLVEAYLTVNQGRIEKAELYGDFFSVQDPALLANCLVGIRPEKAEYEKVLGQMDTRNYIAGLSTQAFLELLTEP